MANARFQSIDERVEKYGKSRVRKFHRIKVGGGEAGLLAMVLNAGRFIAIVLSPMAQSKRESNGGPSERNFTGHETLTSLSGC